MQVGFELRWTSVRVPLNPPHNILIEFAVPSLVTPVRLLVSSARHEPWVSRLVMT